MLENIYSLSTHDIEVEVVPLFVPDQTQFKEQFLYTYNISIKNNSTAPCQLLRRHWIITDGMGRKEEIQGEGVVGQQPMIQPNETYQYSSYCPLPTPTGNMRGTFTFIDSQEKEFLVRVPVFFLREDAIIH